MLGPLWFGAVVQLRSPIVDTAGFYGTILIFKSLPPLFNSLSSWHLTNAAKSLVVPTRLPAAWVAGPGLLPYQGRE